MRCEQKKKKEKKEEKEEEKRTKLPVEVNMPAGLPTKAPVCQSDPVRSQKALTWLGVEPYRVGKPKRIPSASVRSWTSSRKGTEKERERKKERKKNVVGVNVNIQRTKKKNLNRLWVVRASFREHHRKGFRGSDRVQM